VFYDGDKYVKGAERKRTIGQVTFEHTCVNAGFEYLAAKDQTSTTKADVSSKGYSFWVTPRTTLGWEGLIRYDHLQPNTSTALSTSAPINPATTTFGSQQQNRLIAGIAYWFPHQGGVSSALLIDYDGQIFKNITTAPVKAVAAHVLVNF
jgi:hypothetical protein